MTASLNWQNDVWSTPLRSSHDVAFSSSNDVKHRFNMHDIMQLYQYIVSLSIFSSVDSVEEYGKRSVVSCLRVKKEM